MRGLRIYSSALARIVALGLVLGLAFPLAAQTVEPTPGHPAPPPLAAAAPTADRALDARLDTLFAAAYPPDQPGAAVRVQRGDEILLRSAYGMANVELAVPMEPDMVFRVGSLTKQFTAAAVYQLAAAGEVRLEAPLKTYLPDYPEPGASATLHQLLTHTAGIPSYTSRADYMPNSRRKRTVAGMIATWKDDPLDFPAGTRWSYSNSGYFLLGAVIEAVSGQTYEDFLRDRIIRPLTLNNTWYDDPERIIPNRISGYRDGEGGLANAPFLAMSQPYAAGALLSNTADLVRWGQALFATEAVLPAEWRRRLLTPARLTGGHRAGYASGLAIRRYAGHEIALHTGGINGFASFVAYVPNEEITVVVLSNKSTGSPGPAALGIRALAIALGQPLDERPKLTLPPEVLADYAGSYEIDREATAAGEPPVIVVRVEGSEVTLREPGRPARPIRFPAPDELYLDGSLQTGRFERDAHGQVSGLWLSADSSGERRGAKTEPEETARDASGNDG